MNTVAEMRRRPRLLALRCWFGVHTMITGSDDTHLWGECIRCGKRAGVTSRNAIRLYIAREEAAEGLRKLPPEMVPPLADISEAVRIDAAAAELNEIWRTKEGWSLVPDSDKEWLRQAARDVIARYKDPPARDLLSN